MVTPVICVLLGSIVWIAFGQALDCGFVDYDDNNYVYNNPAVTRGLTFGGIRWAFTHVHANNWHPLTSLSHMVDCQLFGLQPWGHHLTNILLHGTAAILLFLALQKLFAAASANKGGAAWADRAGTVWANAFVAALFAVHPLRVESVVWVSERKDVLSGVFFMLALWAYARYARSLQFSWRRYALALLFFGLGLLCKPTLVTLPFVLLLLDYWPLRRLTTRWPVVRALLVEKIPFFVFSALSSVATVLAQGRAVTELRELPLLERIGNAVVSYIAYLGQLIYPAHLAVFYPSTRGHLHAFAAMTAFVGLLIVSVTFFLWRRSFPFLLVGWLWFFGMLVPMIGLVQVGQQSRADRYTYLPMIGIYLLLAWAAVTLCARWPHLRSVTAVAGVLVVTALIACTRAQARYWQNTELLWRHAVEATSNNYIAHYTLGNVLAQQGQLAEAIAQYENSLRIEPKYAQTYNNLGIALANAGRLPEAVAAYRSALRLRPDFAEAYFNLGSSLAAAGDAEEAINQFKECLRIRPSYMDAHLNLARVLNELGRRKEAVRHLAEALRLKEQANGNK